MPKDFEDIATRFFAGHMLVGSMIAEGAGIALTDFRIHDDGFSRFLVGDRGMTARQAGRTMQRLFEIDTYKIMALLALPVARDLSPMLTRCERELARITTELADAGEADEAYIAGSSDTRLEAEIESREADNHYRFSAADAYHKLILRRIAELREQRINGLQTFQEFTERRLAPAMNTCQAVALRQESLSERPGAGNPASLYTGRYRPGKAESRLAGIDGSPRQTAAQAAGNGRGPCPSPPSPITS